MRTVENRCSRLVHGRWRYYDLHESRRDGQDRAAQGLVKPPSFDGKDTMLVNTAVGTRETTGDIQTSRRDTRMTPYEKIRGQKYRKEILPLVEQVFARRAGARVNEHHRAIGEMDNQVNQHIEMPQIH